jgi:hypothetical protein
MLVIILSLLISFCLCENPWICYQNHEWNQHEFTFLPKRPTTQKGLCYELRPDNANQRNIKVYITAGDEIPNFPILAFPDESSTSLIKIDIRGDGQVVKKNMFRVFQMIPQNLFYLFTFFNISIDVVHDEMLLYQQVLRKPMQFKIIEGDEKRFFSQQRAAKILLRQSKAENIWLISCTNWRVMAWSMFGQKSRIENLEYEANLPCSNSIIFTFRKIQFNIKGDIPTKILISLAVLAHVWKVKLVLELNTDKEFQKKYFDILGKLLLKDFEFTLIVTLMGKKFLISQSQLAKGHFYLRTDTDCSFTIFQLLQGKEYLVKGLSISDTINGSKTKNCGLLFFERMKRALCYYKNLESLNISLLKHEYLSCISPFDLLTYYKEIPLNHQLTIFQMTIDADTSYRNRIISQYPIFPFDTLFLLIEKKIILISSISITIQERDLEKGKGFGYSDIHPLLAAMKNRPLKFMTRFCLSIERYVHEKLQRIVADFLGYIAIYYPRIEHIDLKIGTQNVTFESKIDHFLVEMPHLKYIRVNNYFREPKKNQIPVKK